MDEANSPQLSYADCKHVPGASAHPTIRMIIDQGYTLIYRFEDLPSHFSIRELLVRVLDGEPIIGEANFTSDDYETRCQNVQIERAYRRRGIANAMYVFAEIALGRVLDNAWDDGSDRTNSDAAKALWEQPNRPFGNPDVGPGGLGKLKPKT